MKPEDKLKKEVLKEIRKNFDEDLKKKLQPLYDIEQNVHKNTISDLKELFEAVGGFAFDKAIRGCQEQKRKQFEWFEKRLENQLRIHWVWLNLLDYKEFAEFINAIKNKAFEDVCKGER